MWEIALTAEMVAEAERMARLRHGTLVGYRDRSVIDPWEADVYVTQRVRTDPCSY